MIFSGVLRFWRLRRFRRLPIVALLALAVIVFLFCVGNPLDGRWFHLQGKVVDQNGSPVAGATIVCSSGRRSWIPFLGEIDLALHSGFGAEQNFETSTNASGGFSVWGFGTYLNVSVKGAGIQPTPSWDYQIEEVSPPPHLKIYHIWKLNGPERVITGGFRIHGDGKWQFLDLLRGETVSGQAQSDLAVELLAPRVGNSVDQLGWSYTIRAVRGGLIRTKDEYRFLAPPNGYIPMVSYESYATRKGREIPAEHYYFSGRDGALFAELDVEWLPELGYADFSYLANPAGSRILERGLEQRKP